MVILWIGKLFEPLPKAVLACIIVFALKGLLFQIKDFFYLWSINKFESIAWIITFLGVVLLDVDFGLLIGISISIFMVIIRDKFFQLRNLIEYKSNFFDENLIINQEPNLEVFILMKDYYF